MNTRRSQLYLAHTNPPLEVREADANDDEFVPDMRPDEAAEYIACLLASMRAIAIKAKLALLCDLISVAEEEAKFHFRK